MSKISERGKPTASYEIHIRGRVGPELTAAFEGLQADVKPIETVLHGEIAASALDALVARRLPASNHRDLQLGVEQDISDTVRRGWSGLGPLAEDPLALDHRLVTLDGPVTEPIDLRLARHAGDRMLHATLRHARPTPRIETAAAPIAVPVAAGIR